MPIVNVVPFDQSQLLKGTLDLVVMAVIARAESYGYEVVRQVRAAGLAEVREASIYGTLSRLFRAGLVTTRMEASTAGPPRKYYGVSRDGARYLEDARQQWKATTRAVDALLDPTSERTRREGA